MGLYRVYFLGLYEVKMHRNIGKNADSTQQVFKDERARQNTKIALD